MYRLRPLALLLSVCTCFFPHSLQAQKWSDNSRASRLAHEEWMRHGRVIPGHATAELRYRAFQQKLALRKNHPSNSSAIWTSLGPAPLASDATGLGQQNYGWVSGRATAIAVDPSDVSGNTVFSGGAYGGVWKSTNAGPASSTPANVVWTPLTDDQATLAIGALAVQPWSSGVQSCTNNPSQSIVLAGTGETDSSADSYYGLGILHSSDGGNTWDLLSTDSTGTRSFAGLGFSKIAFSSGTPNLVVAAAGATSQGVIEDLENPVTVNRGIYYSLDCGEDWTYTNVNDSGVTISPSSATSVIYNAQLNLFFAAIRYHGFYSSPDGINWTRLLNQPGAGLTALACPPQTSPPSVCPIYRGEITVVPGRSEMYVWYVDAYDIDQGIWQSFDGGVTWSQIDETGIIDCGDIFGGCGTQDGTYNLELAAVPNCAQSDPNCGVTDLYAGAVNIFKCEISPEFPTCNPNVNPPPPPNAVFLNLTHVYGCPPDFGSPAHVHASQHAIGFSLINNNQQDVMFFANDGGIYRSLDGFNDLNDGSCNGTNLFDSLNQTLGSMTQLVAFSQSPSDPNTLLAGAQANGSPATGSAEGNTIWQNVNEPDGGYTLINPSNALEWFTENTGVSIQKCESGISCDAEDFSNGLIVSNATLGGDEGPFFAPFMLDPQNLNAMLVGTCRVWRGDTNGNNFIAISGNFDDGGAPVTCTGAEVNQVRTIATGGAIQGGFSNVIYAGTDGQGPNSDNSPTGGRVLVTTNALQGPNSWANQTSNINSQFFPISSIVLDTTDPTGATAYASIMGFGVSHIWKTTNWGNTWTDFTANLPDAPVNALLLDETTEVLYAGTDVGVFSSSTSNPSWTEVGPASNSGQSGFLPNVSVTGLGIFNANGEKLLRASTYGRGMWEYPLVEPPFQIAVTSQNPLTVFGSTQATFNISINALGGFTGTVNLNCSSMLSNCLIVPNSVTLTNSMNHASAMVTASSSTTGSFTLNVTGTSQTPQFTSPPSVLTLNAISISLLPPSPSSITLGSPATSGPVTVQVTASGPFGGVVNLSCATPLPPGVSCNFTPNVVSPTQGNPATAALTVNTSANTPTNTYSMALEAAISPPILGEPVISQALSLTVTSDFAIAMNNTSASATQGFAGTFTGSLSSSNYSYSVNLSCGAGAPPMCTTNPASVTPSAAGTPFVVTAESNNTGDYSFNLVAQGTDPSKITHTAALTFTSTKGSASPDFAIAVMNPLIHGPVNTPMVFQGTLTALDGYGSPVNLNCGANSPPSCTPSPLTVTPSANGTPFTVTVMTNDSTVYAFNLVAQGTDSSHITHTFALIFDSTATLSFTNNSPQQTINPGQTAQYNLNVAPVGGSFPAPVSFSCAASSLPSGAGCVFHPATVGQNSGATSVTLSVKTSAKTPVATSHLVVSATSGPLTVNSNPEPILTVMGNGQGASPFTINNNTPPQYVAPGQAVSYNLSLSSGDGFSNQVSFACTGLPAASSCSFSPPQVAPGTVGEPSITTLTITTTAQVIASVHSDGSTLYMLAILVPAGFGAFFFAGPKRSKRRRATSSLTLLMTFSLLGLLLSCGGGTGISGGQPGTPTGTYTVTVTGSAGAISETAMPPVGLVVQ